MMRMAGRQNGCICETNYTGQPSISWSVSRKKPIMSNDALRLPESLKLAAKRMAKADDTTMNPFFVVAIADKISAMETAEFFARRAQGAGADAAQRAWDKVGTQAAVLQDRWED